LSLEHTKRDLAHVVCLEKNPKWFRVQQLRLRKVKVAEFLGRDPKNPKAQRTTRLAHKMGLLRIGNKSEVRILMCGLDAAGKTTIIYKMKLGDAVCTIPTIGFNVETVSYQKINFTMWDCGGPDKIRPLWRHYIEDRTVAVIWVVDSNDRERMEESCQELNKMIFDPSQPAPYLLVYANKQDLPNAMSRSEVITTLGLSEYPKEIVWHCEASCATSGDGVWEGMEWLASTLIEMT